MHLVSYVLLDLHVCTEQQAARAHSVLSVTNCVISEEASSDTVLLIVVMLHC